MILHYQPNYLFLFQSSILLNSIQHILHNYLDTPSSQGILKSQKVLFFLIFLLAIYAGMLSTVKRPLGFSSFSSILALFFSTCTYMFVTYLQFVSLQLIKEILFVAKCNLGEVKQRQCWPVVSNTNHMCSNLWLQQGFSNFTLLSQKSIILLMLPAGEVALAVFAPLYVCYLFIVCFITVD